MALAVKHDMYSQQRDALNAYLNGMVQETVYMQEPELFDNGSARVVRLTDRKSLERDYKPRVAGDGSQEEQCRLVLIC